jgi:multiple sugar transport system permease protein
VTAINPEATAEEALAEAWEEGTPKRRGPRREFWIAMAFIAPAMIGFLVFFVYPTIRGFYLSFTEYSLLGTPSWIGLENYQFMWTDKLFWNAQKVTWEYVILNIGFQTALAIGLAVLMHRLTKSTLIRGSILLPYLIANVVVALLWWWLLDYQMGIVNAGLEMIGVDPIAFFGDENWAIPTIAFINVWRHMGYTALLIFAGLQTIPKTVYEAASVDGAGEWRTFWTITMPLLRPVLVLVLVITVTGSFQVFDTVAVTTQGGPINATRVMQVYIVERAFERSDFGYAAAMSAVLFLMLAIITFVLNKTLRAGESDLS